MLRLSPNENRGTGAAPRVKRRFACVSLLYSVALDARWCCPRMIGYTGEASSFGFLAMAVTRAGYGAG